MPQFTFPVGTSSPADAAAIVKRAMSAGFDPLALSQLRGTRMDELRQRRAGDIGAGDVLDAGQTNAEIGDLGRDINEDPDTGARAHQQIANVEDALDEASLVNRGEIGSAAKTIAERNAFARFLDAKAPFQAATSPEGEQALNEASQRRIGEQAASFGLNPAKQKLSAEGTKTVSALHQAVDLGNKLHALLSDPKSGLKEAADENAARDEGYVGQAIDSGTARLKRWAYSNGIIQQPKGYDEATQLADWMKVLATRGLLGGVRNIEWINQIQDHLAQGKLPPAANLKRLELFLKNAPDLENDIYDVELGHVRLPGPGGAAAPAAGAPPMRGRSTAPTTRSLTPPSSDDDLIAAGHQQYQNRR